MKRMQKGFTLIELMIVVAIIGILAAIAIPQYGNYVSRTKATGAVADIEVYKLGIGLCRQMGGSFANCSSAAGAASADGNVPATADTEFLTGLSVAAGVITATTTATLADAAATPLTVLLTPTYTQGEATITWTETGTICNPTRGVAPGKGNC